MALMLGINDVLKRLEYEHPLIFSPIAIKRVNSAMRYNASLARSLCCYHDLVTNSKTKTSMAASIEVNNEHTKGQVYIE